jgi:hypothetical protein
VQFGVFPEPGAARLDEILTLAGIADRDGLDLVRQPHFVIFAGRRV